MQRKSLRTSNKVALVVAAVVAALATLVTTANAVVVTVPAATWSQTLGGKTFSATFGPTDVESTSNVKTADTKFVLATPDFSVSTTLPIVGTVGYRWMYQMTVDVDVDVNTPGCALQDASVTATVTIECITTDGSGNARPITTTTLPDSCSTFNSGLGGLSLGSSVYAASDNRPKATLTFTQTVAVASNAININLISLAGVAHPAAATLLTAMGAKMKINLKLDSLQETGATFSATAEAGIDLSGLGSTFGSTSINSAISAVGFNTELSDTINLVDKAVAQGVSGFQVGDCLSDAIPGKCLTIGTVSADTAANCFSADDVASPASARGTVAGAAVATLVAALAMA